MKYLITGSSGFIGFHLARRLLEQGAVVLGIDALTEYYDVALKLARQAILEDYQRFHALTFDITDAAKLRQAIDDFEPDVILHFAAQAGVRYSITHPDAYVSTNLVGTFNVLEACRHHPVRHLLIASTSSVYGANTQMPFAEVDAADRPLTLYAATKKAGEAMGHAYAHLFGVPTTELRFFTVYGPWGRPDMALFKFTRNILAGMPIDVYNHGQLARDFTYVDDLVSSIVALTECVPLCGKPVCPMDSLSTVAPYRVVNVGGGAPVSLDRFISVLEEATGRKAIRRNLPMQDGDVANTFASTVLLECLVGRAPLTPIDVGIPHFVDWYIDHYHITPLAAAAAASPALP